MFKSEDILQPLYIYVIPEHILPTFYLYWWEIST